MKKQLPIGFSDYKTIIDENYYYIDKTLFIDDILKYGGHTTLLPRPRRFGKTLNMSMLRYFFEKTEQSNAYLFEDKKIWQLPERAALQGKFPVIFVTFKDIKESSWQKTRDKLVEVIADEYDRHNYLLDTDLLSRKQKEIFNQIIDLQASDAHYESSLAKLAKYLYRFYQVKPIVLLDEYDAPIHAGFLNGYYSEVLLFVRGLMSGVFKDNTYLEHGVITGILHIVKEGIFSGLNNLKVLTLLDDRMNDKFGFTEQEVGQLLLDYDLSEIKQDFKDWYNGYLMGDGYLMGSVKIYNPWSALSCVDKGGRLNPYWVNTSDNALIYKVVAQSQPAFKDACPDLIQGKIIEKIKIIEDTALPKINEQVDFIWSLLLFTGYVTPHAYRTVDGIEYTDLMLPNKELHILFQTLVGQLFTANLKSVTLETFYKALQEADGESFEDLLSKFIAQSMSVYDISAEEPEKSYHLFVLGLFVVLADQYMVISNRESGYGRFDIMLIPKDTLNPGIIIEFKKMSKRETMSECADRALEQIKDRNYATQLVQQGVKKIVAFGIALHKKEVLLKQEDLSMITQK